MVLLQYVIGNLNLKGKIFFDTHFICKYLLLTYVYRRSPCHSIANGQQGHSIVQHVSLCYALFTVQHAIDWLR